MSEEEYRGPVLLSADAAAGVMSELVGPNVLGRRPMLGQNARTIGDWANNYKSRVLPDFLSVVDDPTRRDFRRATPCWAATRWMTKGSRPAGFR